jgi:large subunit ribosomal protein L30
MGKLKVTQIRSAIRRDQNQKDIIKALGLHRLHHTVVHSDVPQIRGMIRKVRHLITVEEVRE